jgi:hypothetical protein
MKRILIIAWILLMTGCGAGHDGAPVKSGGDLDALRKSPCACADPIDPRSQWHDDGDRA